MWSTVIMIVFMNNFVLLFFFKDGVELDDKPMTESKFLY